VFYSPVDQLLKLEFQCIDYNGVRYTPDMLTEEIARVASLLHRLTNTHTSPFILLYASNTIAAITAFYAIVSIGKVVVLIDPHIGTLELHDIIQQTEPCASCICTQQKITEKNIHLYPERSGLYFYKCRKWIHKRGIDFCRKSACEHGVFTNSKRVEYAKQHVLFFAVFSSFWIDARGTIAHARIV